MAITGDDILKGVKRRITIPSSQRLFDDTDILQMVDDVIKIKLVPLIISMRQDYFVVTQDVPIVAGQSEYKVPSRAVGRTLRDLKRKLPAGDKVDLSRLSIEDEHRDFVDGLPTGFYFKSDQVVLVPVPQATSDVIEMWFELMPSRMTKIDQSAVVTSIAGGDVSVSSVPGNLSIGAAIDFIDGKSGGTCKSTDKIITNIVGNIISFATTDVPSTLAAGDYISLAGYTPIMQLPDECYPYLETESCKRILNANSDYEGANILKDDAKEEEKNLKMLLEPRIRGESTKVINRLGFARGTKSRWKWGFLR